MAQGEGHTVLLPVWIQAGVGALAPHHDVVP
jgi:hypothetical protein